MCSQFWFQLAARCYFNDVVLAAIPEPISFARFRIEFDDLSGSVCCVTIGAGCERFLHRPRKNVRRPLFLFFRLEGSVSELFQLLDQLLLRQ